MLKTIKYCERNEKNMHINGKMFHVHGLESLNVKMGSYYLMGIQFQLMKCMDDGDGCTTVPQNGTFKIVKMVIFTCILQ